ncbi:hypothetical protein B0H14DRAFT_216821 [Mycena olivaceomarginata]|nr:hypothetical protein B0H14DRAFT_216821 [Mycena olivaceomarginata]
MSMMLDTAMVDVMNVDMHHEPWFDTEAKMEDDVPHFNDHDSTLSVEVDMDDHYQEIEYEMGDGEGEENYEDMSSDLLDIEVHDIVEPPLEEDATLEAVNPPESHLFGIGLAETSSPLPLPAPTPAMSPLPPDTDLPDATSEHAAPAEEVHVLVEEENVGDRNPDPPVDLAAPLAVDENVETNDQFQQLHQESGEEQGVAEAAQPEEQYSSSIDELQRPELGTTDVPQPEEHLSSSDALASDNREVDEPVAGDPHEISDGVYIDPPPAVLVSFESSDSPDICLFNQPARSRSPSPSVEGQEQAYQVFDLLLHHRPILYYEPLASVFEALRQEELRAWIPHLAESELVLDAYDLQLVISEDNVYAREVTLHDLNVLHDGSDIAGPLRLRIKSVAPRFILRYHLLQDQVSRLNIAAAAGDEQEASADPTEQAQEQLENHQQDNVEPQPEEAQDDVYHDATSLRANENQSRAAEDRPQVGSKVVAPDTEVAEPEAEPTVQHAENVEENEDEQHAEVGQTGGGEGHGEKLQHEEADGAETGDFPPLPDEDEEEEEHVEEPEVEEEFVVVETPGAKPVIPLTGFPVDNTGNEVETLDLIPSSDSGLQAESGPSSLQPQFNEDESETNINTEDVTGALASSYLFTVDSVPETDRLSRRRFRRSTDTGGRV